MMIDNGNNGNNDSGSAAAQTPSDAKLERLRRSARQGMTPPRKDGSEPFTGPDQPNPAPIDDLNGV